MVNSLERGDNPNTQKEEIPDIPKEIYVPDFSLIPEEHLGFRGHMEEFAFYQPKKLEEYPMSRTKANEIIAKYLKVNTSSLISVGDHLLRNRVLPYHDKLSEGGRVKGKELGPRGIWAYAAVSHEIKNRIGNPGSNNKWKGVENNLEEKLGPDLYQEIFKVVEDIRIFEIAKIKNGMGKNITKPRISEGEIRERMMITRIPAISEDVLKSDLGSWGNGDLRLLAHELLTKGRFEQLALGVKLGRVLNVDVIDSIRFSALFFPESDDPDENFEIIKLKIQNFLVSNGNIQNNELIDDLLKADVLLKALNERDKSIDNLGNMFRGFRVSAKDMGFVEYAPKSFVIYDIGNEEDDVDEEED